MHNVCGYGYRSCTYARNMVIFRIASIRKSRGSSACGSTKWFRGLRSNAFIFMLFKIKLHSSLFLGITCAFPSETIDKCSRLFGASETWSETVHYRPLVTARHPHTEGA